MRELAFATIALLGLAVLTGFWLEAPTTRNQMLPSLEAPPLNVSAALPETQADELAELEALRFLSTQHTGLADHEIEVLAETIVAEARRNHFAPALLIGLIRVESAGYNFAISPVGAYGLMQIMPSTGEELARRFDVPWHGPDTLFNPEANVRMGTAYLRELADRYNGDVATALTAYNWGPGNVDRRKRAGGRVPTFYATQVFEAREATLLASVAR
jgi:soluble lytic murein transglycosylase-like protein